MLDNLNTHFEKSFYGTFPEEEAERILERISFFYTPEACELAENGRDRDKRHGQGMPRKENRKRGVLAATVGTVGNGKEPGTEEDKLDIHKTGRRQKTGQTLCTVINLFIH